jgi:hypothetical protein
VVKRFGSLRLDFLVKTDIGSVLVNVGDMEE